MMAYYSFCCSAQRFLCRSLLSWSVIIYCSTHFITLGRPRLKWTPLTPFLKISLEHLYEVSDYQQKCNNKLLQCFTKIETLSILWDLGEDNILFSANVHAWCPNVAYYHRHRVHWVQWTMCYGYI